MKIFKSSISFTDEEVIQIIESGKVEKIDRIKSYLSKKIVSSKKDLTNVKKKLVNLNNGKDILTLSFNRFLEEINTGNSKTPLFKIFERCFESELINLMNSESEKVSRSAESFLIQQYLIDILFKSKTKIKKEELRQETYSDSIMRLFNILKGNSGSPFRKEASLKTIFNKIFWGKYADKVRFINNKTNRVINPAYASFEEQIQQLNPHAQQLLTTEIFKVENEILNDIIRWLKLEFPKCHEILYANSGLNYTYREIAVKRGSTEGSIKEQARKCRAKIVEAYEKAFKKTR